MLDDHDRGTAHRLVIELAPHRPRSTHTTNERPGCEPGAIDDRLVGARNRQDDVAITHGRFCALHRHDLDPQLRGHLPGVSHAVVVRAAPGLDAAQLAHLAHGTQLGPRLTPRAQDAQRLGVLTRHVLRRDRGYGPGAY